MMAVMRRVVWKVLRFHTRTTPRRRAGDAATTHRATRDAPAMTTRAMTTTTRAMTTTTRCARARPTTTRATASIANAGARRGRARLTSRDDATARALDAGERAWRRGDAGETREARAVRRTRAMRDGMDGDAREDATREGLASEGATREGRGRALGACAMVACAVAVTAMMMPESALAAKAAAVASSSEGVLAKALSWVMHLDKHLAELFVSQGKFAYGILFAIIFAETGFVVTPFLPGDSLLFATGALGALGVVNFPLTCALLFAAATLGDTVNYSIGSYVGANYMETHPKIFPPEYIAKTRKFYDQYGGKTVVLARFFVIVRTFAPFVAGVANMNYSKFITYNVVGAALWIASFMGLGYFFGAIPAVQENFALAVAGIVVLSLVPVIVEIIQHATGSKGDESETAPAAT